VVQNCRAAAADRRAATVNRVLARRSPLG